jgi:uncharacterized phage-associated protein
VLIETPRTYDARAVANYFLELANAEGLPVTPMAIQKLVYFAHGWMLAVYGRPLISQRIEAWDYGPVIKDLYHEFKRFGDSPILEPARAAQLADTLFRITTPEIPKYQDPEVASLLNQVWEAYKHFTAIQLSNLTHAPGSPWSMSRKHNHPVIDDDVIKRFFSAFPK